MMSQACSRFSLLALNCCAGILFSASIGALAQEPKKAPPQPGPMLADGVESFDTPDFQLSLVTVPRRRRQLPPSIQRQTHIFDFTPGDRLTERSHNGYYHPGRHRHSPESRGMASGKIISTALRRSSVKNAPHESGCFRGGGSEQRILGCYSGYRSFVPGASSMASSLSVSTRCESHQHPDRDRRAWRSHGLQQRHERAHPRASARHLLVLLIPTSGSREAIFKSPS